MAAVAPPPAPAAAPASAPVPAAAPVADQTTDLLQKLSLDSKPKAADATEPAVAKKGAAGSQPLPVLQDFMDPNMYYMPAYYYGGYDGEWDDYARYLNPDGLEIAPAVYGDIYGYGYAPTTNYMPPSTYNSNVSSAKNQNKSSTPQQKGTQNRRPTSKTGSVAPTYPNQMYTSPWSYTHYGNSMKTGLAYWGTGYDSSIYGPWGVGMDNRYRPRGRGNGYYGYGNESQDGTIELSRGPRSGCFKNQKISGHTDSTAVKEQTLPCSESKNDSAVPDKAQFNKDDFPVQYDAAKFFVIKSYSEDDIHKSIKYNVWASTRNGNKKLDGAYQEAQSKGSACPIFLFFSVNTSGQFLGVAEMTGSVDFEKTLEYWQQDKWSGSFAVKWHIVKDVPNNILKHIILVNNENKPVTNSRDTQEVHLEQGLEMLQIFKEHVSKTSILDDFAFYDSRQKSMLEKRVKQQQIQKQVWDNRAPTSVTGGQHQDVANGKPKISVPNGVNGELKTPTENGVAPAPVATYASKVAQSAPEKPVLANGKVVQSAPEKPVLSNGKVAQSAPEKPVLTNGVAAKTG